MEEYQILVKLEPAQAAHKTAVSELQQKLGEKSSSENAAMLERSRQALKEKDYARAETLAQRTLEECKKRKLPTADAEKALRLARDGLAQEQANRSSKRPPAGEATAAEPTDSNIPIGTLSAQPQPPRRLSAEEAAVSSCGWPPP